MFWLWDFGFSVGGFRAEGLECRVGFRVQCLGLSQSTHLFNSDLIPFTQRF